MAGLYDRPRFRLVGDRGLLAEYGESIDPEINRKVRIMGLLLDRDRPRGVEEIIPTYRAVLIRYDPLETEPAVLEEALIGLEDRLDSITVPEPERVEIPVCYGGPYGPDLDHVAQVNGLSADRVVEIHTSTAYQIYMIGFTPGFPFLGGMDERIATPRLESPRTAVPAGSVGIANNQTGMYPVTSPGGWQIIGRTPLRLFAPERENPFLYKAGDLIEYKPISEEEYLDLGGEAMR